MSIEFRAYKPSDKKGLIQCVEDFQKYLMGIDDSNMLYCPKGYGLKYVNNMIKELKRSTGVIFVAIDGKGIIGYCAGAINITRTAEAIGLRPAKAGRVVDLYVDARYRKQKIGLKLMNMMNKYFKQLKCKTMYVEVFAPNSIAREFYREYGFEEISIDLKKKI
ncbi:MAG: GNAT family N-acetyltransferase [Candidatus Magasanikbacteria bacterium]